METAARAPALLLLMAAAVLAELWWRVATGRGYDRSTALTSLGLAGGNLLFGAANGAALAAIFGLAWSVAPWRLPLGDWRVWTAAFLLVEFAYYWSHRLGHRLRWMWASHSVHHSAEELTFLSAIRLGWTNLLSGAWICFLPLVLLGFDPALVGLLLAVNLRYQFFLHTEAPIRLGPLEWVLNSPSHHRVHHGLNRLYLDRNYGGVLIVFDRLFGTFAAEQADEPIRFGLAHRPPESSPLRLAFREWRWLVQDMRAAGSLRAALRIALGRP
jgi:sterol desaturase/sphingolipid hydroxylase (fatty acid hydroxylase superfamily)